MVDGVVVLLGDVVEEVVGLVLDELVDIDDMRDVLPLEVLPPVRVVLLMLVDVLVEEVLALAGPMYNPPQTALLSNLGDPILLFR